VENSFSLRIGINVATVQILHPCGGRQVAHESGESNFAFTQRQLHSASAADVVNDPCEYRARRQPRLTDRQRHRKYRAVLATAPNFAPKANDAPYARTKIVAEILVVLTVVRLGHEHFYILPDEFLLGVPKDAFSGWINAFDDPLLING